MLLSIADIFENSSLLYFKFTKISNPLPSPSSKNLLQIQKLATISRKIFSKESAGREISLCNAFLLSLPPRNTSLREVSHGGSGKNRATCSFPKGSSPREVGRAGWGQVHEGSRRNFGNSLAPNLGLSNLSKGPARLGDPSPFFRNRLEGEGGELNETSRQIALSRYRPCLHREGTHPFLPCAGSSRNSTGDRA